MRPRRNTSDQFKSLPSTRKEARALGADRFFTSIPCKNGHFAPRYVSTTNCAACQVEHARRRGGWKARPSKEAYLEKARGRIKRRGAALLSTEYVSAKTKLKVRCAEGHEFSVTPDNLEH